MQDCRTASLTAVSLPADNFAPNRNDVETLSSRLLQPIHVY